MEISCGMRGQKPASEKTVNLDDIEIEEEL